MRIDLHFTVSIGFLLLNLIFYSDRLIASQVNSTRFGLIKLLRVADSRPA